MVTPLPRESSLKAWQLRLIRSVVHAVTSPSTEPATVRSRGSSSSRKRAEEVSCADGAPFLAEASSSSLRLPTPRTALTSGLPTAERMGAPAAAAFRRLHGPPLCTTVDTTVAIGASKVGELGGARGVQVRLSTLPLIGPMLGTRLCGSATGRASCFAAASAARRPQPESPMTSRYGSLTQPFAVCPPKRSTPPSREASRVGPARGIGCGPGGFRATQWHNRPSGDGESVSTCRSSRYFADRSCRHGATCSPRPSPSSPKPPKMATRMFGLLAASAAAPPVTSASSTAECNARAVGGVPAGSSSSQRASCGRIKNVEAVRRPSSCSGAYESTAKPPITSIASCCARGPSPQAYGEGSTVAVCPARATGQPGWAAW